MPTERSPFRDEDSYDAFELALKAARIPDALYDGYGDIWVNSPRRAYALIERWKRGDAQLHTAVKAATDPVSLALERLTQAAHSAGKTRPDSEIIAALDALAQQLGAVPGQIRRQTVGDSEKIAKAARPGSLDTLMDGVSAAAQRGKYRS